MTRSFLSIFGLPSSLVIGTGPGTAGPNGPLYTNQVQTTLGNSGYGVLNGGPAPLDSDQDGLPDFWETATGSNPTAAAISLSAIQSTPPQPSAFTRSNCSNADILVTR